MAPTSHCVAAIIAACALTFTTTLAHAATCDATGMSGTVVNIGGSTAAKPMIKQLSGTLAGKGIRVIYWKLGSCAGLSDITTNTNVTGAGAGTYWDENNNLNELACDAPNGGTALDVAVSDVYPSSCNNIALTASQKDFNSTPIQVFSFIVPPLSSKTSISEEAAQVVYGFGGATYSVTPWTDVNYIFKRDPTKSGTYSMLAKLLAFDSSAKEKGTVPGAGDSQAIVDSVSGANATFPDKAIGVVSEDYADANRTGTKAVKILAYQDKGAACGFYPDSSKSTFDKINVRTGLYPFWGPIHFIANVDNTGHPINPQAAVLLSYFEMTTVSSGDAGVTLAESDKKTMIDNIVAAFTIPQCAMKVQRSSEVSPASPPASYSPAEPCGCYYEYKATGATSCTQCQNDTPCGSGKCRYGYCEAK